MRTEPARTSCIQIAIGDERSVAGDAQLSTVGMPRHDQVGAVFGHRVQHPQVRRVRDGESEIRTGVEGAGNVVVVVSSNVRIVNAADVDLAAVRLEGRSAVAEIEPAPLGEAGNQITPGKLRSTWLQL